MRLIYDLFLDMIFSTLKDHANSKIYSIFFHLHIASGFHVFYFTFFNRIHVDEVRSFMAAAKLDKFKLPRILNVCLHWLSPVFVEIFVYVCGITFKLILLLEVICFLQAEIETDSLSLQIPLLVH